MNGVSRFLSRRDKHSDKRLSKGSRSKSQPVPSDLYKILTNEELKIREKDEEKKVQALVQRLEEAGITKFGEKQAHYAISKYPNDLDTAFEMLVLAAESFDGLLRDFDPNVRLLGAENRNAVTCYLDALLFAMFARLDSFEGMLFDNSNNEARNELAGILRLWVNLLRSGKLITVDLMKHLQDALGKCGWEEATEVRQQDASEAFTFITGALDLPLLTLKVDIYHTGKEDKNDDHKFVNERLLEVAIPGENEPGKLITLEDCLENYFNNRVEVKRHLRRQNTLKSRQNTSSSIHTPDTEKAEVLHIETVEVAESPTALTPTKQLTPEIPVRPIEGRRRADSIFSERYIGPRKSSKHGFDEKQTLDEMLEHSSAGRARSPSLRKEVLMPAWQFFSLIPWYNADKIPQSDDQVAAHFAAKRPMLGICLKRYLMLPDGTPKRLDTYIDIPLEIGLPHFVADDSMDEEGPLFGNFKLVLQSVVCHRGVSVDSGHYIALIRANLPADSRSDSPHNHSDDAEWLRFDDLAQERVTKVDMKQALKEESPYLLFYQVQPIDEELARGNPPTYDEAQSVAHSEAPIIDPSGETLTSADVPTVDPSRETLASVDIINPNTVIRVAGPSTLLKVDTVNSDGQTGRTSMSSNQESSAILEEMATGLQSGSRGRAGPATPEEQKGGFFSSRRNSKNWMGGNKSRPTSQSGESRLSLTMSRLTGRASKDKLQNTQNADAADSEDLLITVNEVVDGSNDGTGTSSPVKALSNGIGRSKSKKGKEKKKSDKKSAEEKKHKRPDRECVVM
ncbi:cysteine proteinase [Delitschia confertaspora ATCC 74209]|uniref:ubiquitinyl hydrolase 1 n=1 Tax=Delitschia confertaspora ATCC 74209 TaxID=1513339 RepID=A0A9P4JU81_9PLEO|nr:cysteine proteinase [Delitschia confertaspora ATCC 74209]